MLATAFLISFAFRVMLSQPSGMSQCSLYFSLGPAVAENTLLRPTSIFLLTCGLLPKHSGTAHLTVIRSGTVLSLSLITIRPCPAMKTMATASSWLDPRVTKPFSCPEYCSHHPRPCVSRRASTEVARGAATRKGYTTREGDRYCNASVETGRRGAGGVRPPSPAARAQPFLTDLAASTTLPTSWARLSTWPRRPSSTVTRAESFFPSALSL